jgi:dTDP-4-amino-4,6-dideoxygalactose transaminase
VFSFYPTKNLGAIGNCGIILTDDTAVADRVRTIREYGWRTRQVCEMVGQNSRLDELQAAVLRVKLGRLAADNEARRAHAAAYSVLLSGTAVHYPVPLHLEPAYRGRRGVATPPPHAEAAAAGVLSLPMYPRLEAAGVRRVAAAVRDWCERAWR